MKLRQNVFGILYTVIFMLVMTLGLFQMVNLTIALAPSPYMMTGILVFGLIIFLILAYFAKAKDLFRVIQVSNAPAILIEIVVTLACLALCLYADIIRDGLTDAIIYTLLLLCIYLSARLTGGRLCGIVAMLTGFVTFFTLSGTSMVSTDSGIDTLCFLIPYILFLLIVKVLIPHLITSDFMLVCSYIVLSFVFTLSIALNPLVLVLLLGCIISLCFLAPSGETKGLAKHGVVSAAIVLVFTVIMLVGLWILMPDLLTIPEFMPDTAFPLEFNSTLLDYIITKYSRPIIYLNLSFAYGLLPTLLGFFSLIGGYYALCKKSSYISPFILAYLGMFGYYMLIDNISNPFYYMTYLLPVFAAYGFTNTLLKDEPVAKDTQVAEEPVPEKPTVPEEMSVEEAPVDETPVKETPAEETPTEETPTEETPTEETPTEEAPTEETPKKKKEKKKKDKKSKKTSEDVVKSVVISTPSEDDIPEWSMPEEFMPDYVPPEDDDLLILPKPDPGAEAEAMIEDETDTSLDTIEMPEEVALDSFDDMPEEEAMLDSFDDISEEESMLDSSLGEIDSEEDMYGSLDVQGDDDVSLDSLDMQGDSDATLDSLGEPEELTEESVDEPIDESVSVDSENMDDDLDDMDGNMLDLDQFISTEGLISDEEGEEGVSDDLSSDEELHIDEGTFDIPEDDSLEDDSLEDDLTVDDTSEGDDEDAMLNDLLERLDLNEPIKRMNEIAQEDIADVIEREEEQKELSEALPLKPSNSTLPKYQKPKFDIDIEPVNIPLDDQYSGISEYDEVPTVHDLEDQWKDDAGPVIETVAVSVEDDLPVEEPQMAESDSPNNETIKQPEQLHTEEVIRKNGMGKRSYHRIIIR